MFNHQQTQPSRVLLFLLCGICTLLLLYSSAGAVPRFYPAAGQAADSLWVPRLDSLDQRAIDLNGEWNWHTRFDRGVCRIPSCYSDFTGEVVFERSFVLPDNGQQNDYRLWFGGVTYACRILINDVFISSHAGGSASFEVQLPARNLHFGSVNRLSVAVDNGLSSKNTLPLKMQSWDPLNYGGIYREVFLFEGPRLRLDQVRWEQGEGQRVRARRGQPAYIKDRLSVSVLVQNQELLRIGEDSLSSAEDVWVEGVLRDADEVELARARVEGQVAKLAQQWLELELEVDTLHSWSPEAPVLYSLQLILGQEENIVHARKLSVGLRALSIEEGQLFLNGDPFEIRALSYVGDHPDYGISLDPPTLERDLESMRNLGINTLLSMRGAPHPYLRDLCDQLGIFIIEELPVWRIPPRLLAREGVRQLAADQLKELMQRDGNHPCLLALSAGSGMDFTDPLVADYLRGIRPESASCDVLFCAGGFLAGGAQTLGQGMLPGLDFILFEGASHGAKELDPPPQLDLPLVYSRVSQPVEAGNREGYENPWSELRQARHMQQALVQLREWRDQGVKGIAGSVMHSYSDWRGGRPLLWVPPGRDRYLCPLGIVSYDRVARSAYKELGSLFSGGPGATLTRGEHKAHSPSSYPLVGFGLLILLLIGYKQNNVLAHNLRRSFSHSHGFFVDVQDNRIYQFGQALFIWILCSGALGVMSSSLLHYLRKSMFFDHLLSQFFVLNSVKEWLIRLSWNPLESIGQLSLLAMALFVLAAFGLRILGLLFNARFTLQQSMTFLCWSAANLLVLIPLGIVFFRLLEVPQALLPTALLVLVLLLWFLLRLLKAMRIAFEGSFVGVFLLLMILLVAFLGLLMAYYENAFSVIEYIEYYRRIYGV